MVYLATNFVMQEVDLVNFGGFVYVTGMMILIFFGSTLIAMVLVYVIDLHLLLKRYIT